MNELINTVGILGRPYAITRSRLGAITKVYKERYICDLTSLKELFQSIGEKLGGLKVNGIPAFSFLISFSDQTHHDGAASDLQGLSTIPIGKQTERTVMRWLVKHDIEGIENELSITIRISNPINPLIFLQAALSKSPSEIDNMEFEMGSTCVTVDGAGQGYADEIFLRVKNWMEARNKPHPFIEIENFYLKYEWWIDQLNSSLMPLLAITALSLYVAGKTSQSEQITSIPILIAVLFVLQTAGGGLNGKMRRWASKSGRMSVFAITNGDQDAVTKNAANARNGFLKLVGSGVVSFVLNIAAGLVCWWLVKA